MRMILENSTVNVKESMGGCPGKPNPGLLSRIHATILPGRGNARTRYPFSDARRLPEAAGKNFGRLPKRTTGGDCKSSGTAYGGSNPSPPTRTVEQFGSSPGSYPGGRGFKSRPCNWPPQDGRGRPSPIPEPVWRKSRRTGLPAGALRGVRVRIPGQAIALLVEWQTRRLQVPVSERTSGFKSRRGHGVVCRATPQGDTGKPG